MITGEGVDAKIDEFAASAMELKAGIRSIQLWLYMGCLLILAEKFLFLTEN